MFANLFNRLREEFAYQRDLAEVQSMDDRQLADIGVSRMDLAEALRAGRHAAPKAAQVRSDETRLAA